MSGDAFARYLQAYCDGELEPTKTLEVEGHLEVCLPCRRAVEAEHAFRDGLRAKAGRVSVPPHVDKRLRRALTELERENGLSPLPAASGRRAWAVAIAASVVFLAMGGVLGVLLVPRLDRPALNPLVAALVSEHVRFAPQENPAELSSGSTAQVAVWVQGEIGHPVRVPDYRPAGIRLLGGRTALVSGRRAGAILYEKGRALISLFAFPRYGTSLDGLQEVRWKEWAVRTGDDRGRQILLWEHGEMVYALVSDVGWDELFQCARVFFETVES
jgi:anti-sigma factor RsiW